MKQNNTDKNINTTSPKISVLMPIYATNEQYLKEAIDSVLNQTFDNFELLILDDAPHDNRKSFILSYKDTRIKYYQNTINLGISQSRNKLIDMAKGEYLAIMDHDDISLPTRFMEQVKYLDTHNEVGVVGTKAIEYHTKKEIMFPSDDYAIKMTLMHDCAIIHSSSMLRRDVLIKNNIHYQEMFSPSEDYKLFFDLIEFTKFHNLNDEPLFVYRNHAQNTTHKQQYKMISAANLVRMEGEIKYPLMYKTMTLSSKIVTRVRFLGIGILRIEKFQNKTKIYICGIPFIYIKKYKKS